MQYSVQGARAQQDAIYRSLESEDTEVIGGRCEMMENIQDYLESSYFLAINPLRELRKAFPNYNWKFHRVRLARAIRTVGQSDFVWRTNWYDSDTSHDVIDLVTATAVVARDPLRMFFAGHRNASEVTTRMIEFVKSCVGEPAYMLVSNK